MRFLLFLALFSLTQNSTAQTKYPKNYFRSPLDIPLHFAGTFGELRSNHFHSGVDLKTKQRKGLPVYAIADGFVSRIRVSHGGFGKALYLQHPNGYSSVYAHLQKFAPTIQKHVKTLQYKRKSYQIQNYPDSATFRIKKGDIIGYSGNSGSSGGPHLHFEIRDTQSQKPINPMHFAISCPDTKAPKIKGVYLYDLNTKTNTGALSKKTIAITKQKDGSYKADLIKTIGDIGIGISTYDHQDNSYNKNGVYAVELLVNQTPVFAYDFETFSFSETRYINSFIDYAHFKKYKRRIQKCFIAQRNALSIYSEKKNNGYITIKQGFSYTITLLVKDFNYNTTTITIPVYGSNKAIATEKPIALDKNSYYLISKRDNSYTTENATVFFKANTFYKNKVIHIVQNKDTLKIHDEQTPVHKRFSLTIDAKGKTQKDLEKTFIARLTKKGNYSYQTTKTKGTLLSARPKTLGTYVLVKDSIAPVITALNFKNKQQLTNYRFLKLKIEDDLSGINTYSASINDRWVLLEYDYKTKTVTFDFEDLKHQAPQYNLKVKVSDNVGNTSIFTHSFFYTKK